MKNKIIAIGMFSIFIIIILSSLFDKQKAEGYTTREGQVLMSAEWLRSGTDTTTTWENLALSAGLSATSTVFFLGGNHYFGIEYIAGGTSPDIRLDWFPTNDTLLFSSVPGGTVTASLADTNRRFATVMPPVCRGVHFRVTGNSGTGADTTISVRAIKQ